MIGQALPLLGFAATCASVADAEKTKDFRGTWASGGDWIRGAYLLAPFDCLSNMSDSTPPLHDLVQGPWRRFLEEYEPLRGELYRYCRFLTRSPWDAEDLAQDVRLVHS
jgi:hypothetical protein